MANHVYFDIHFNEVDKDKVFKTEVTNYQNSCINKYFFLRKAIKKFLCIRCN